MGLSLFIVAVHWEILDNISASDPASEMVAPMYLKLVKFEVSGHLPLFLCECR